MRHPIRGESTGWRTDTLRARSESNLPPRKTQRFFSDRAQHILTRGRRRPSSPRQVDSLGGTRDRAPPGAILTLHRIGSSRLLEAPEMGNARYKEVVGIPDSTA